MDGATLLVALVALAVSMWAAIIAYQQLRAGKDAAGGRGIAFDVAKVTQFVINNQTRANYRAYVELFGPGSRYQAELCLVRGGQYLLRSEVEWDEGFEPDDDRKAITTRKVLSCMDEPLRWDFSVLPADRASDMWCMFTWVDPRADELWTGAYARRLSSPGVLYEWHWYVTRRIRKWLYYWGIAERKRQWRWHRAAAQKRPLGAWREHHPRHLVDRHGPAMNLDSIK